MKLTVAEAVVKYIDNQYISIDNEKYKFVEGIFTIFGHGNVLGIGHALYSQEHQLNVLQGKNEQGMSLAAMGYAKQKKRLSIYAITTSIGPGAANLVTAAACATVNKIPMLLLPGDSFANRKPDPVLQQIEKSESQAITTNNTLEPVSQYFDRINRPEQLYSALENAFSILTDPNKTGAVTIALPQDVQAEKYDFDNDFFQKKIWEIKREIPSKSEIDLLMEKIEKHEKICFIVGGGLKYSLAEHDFQKLSKLYNIPFVETQAGKGAIVECPTNMGGIGVTGNLAANKVIKTATLIIAFGTRYTDFTSKSNTINMSENQEIINVNINNFDGKKQQGFHVKADIKLVINQLLDRKIKQKKSNYYDKYKKEWNLVKNNILKKEEIQIMDNSEQSIKEFSKKADTKLNQAATIIKLNKIIEDNAIIVTASGSLPGDLQRLWEVKTEGTYHVEYGYSCMGYEINAAIGVKLAEPDRPVYSFVGDGSFMMLHSEIHTSLQIKSNINILLFDNSGFGCINNLQKGYQKDGFRTEFRGIKAGIEGNIMLVDYSKIAEGYGALGIKINNEKELKKIKNNNQTTLYDIKVLPKTMTRGYESWWDVGFNCSKPTKSQEKKIRELNKNRNKRRRK